MDHFKKKKEEGSGAIEERASAHIRRVPCINYSNAYIEHALACRMY